MTISEKVPVWLDCDTGNDDVFAILLACFHPRLNLVGISTVHGNAPVEKTTHNTLAVLDVLKVNIPVYAGESKPLEGCARFATDIHGDQGLGGVDVSQQTILKQVTKIDYLTAIYNAIIENEDEINIICTGSLTNLSKLLIKYPNIDKKIRYISIMGGGINLGNVTKYAEFNFNVDSYAANYIMTKISKNKIILSPLNLTHKVRATKAIRDLIKSENDIKFNIFRSFFYNILMFFNQSYIDKHDDLNGPPIHDPVAVFSLFPYLDEDFDKYGYKCLRTKANVVKDGDQKGQLIIDSKEESAEIFIGMEIDVQKFWNEFLTVLDIAESHVRNFKIDE